ncbi:MAG: ATP-binding protein, partial [Candidatus Bathyarchaeia archaeon]
MRILSLEIKNIRGIKSIKIEPEGENVVVFGPNGTGKSAIVDAIDFLLTGKISRLTGEGAKSLSLREHGPHVDSRENLKDTVVTAKVKIGKKEVTMQRTMNKPSTLKVYPKEDVNLVQGCLAVT